jgi:hypothetical protein
VAVRTPGCTAFNAAKSAAADMGTLVPQLLALPATADYCFKDRVMFSKCVTVKA